MENSLYAGEAAYIGSERTGATPHGQECPIDENLGNVSSETFRRKVHVSEGACPRDAMGVAKGCSKDP